MILMRNMTARFPRALETHPRIPALDAGAVERLLAAEDAAGLEALALERTRLLWLDDQFVKAGTSKALEPHPRLALLPAEVMWSMAQSQERVTKLLEWGASRHREIELEAADRYRYGWRGYPGRSREIGGG